MDSTGSTYTGAPDECPRCWPHKIHKSNCETGCDKCKAESGMTMAQAWREKMRPRR